MTDSSTVPTFADYLTVSQAAAFLGVSPWTLRNWDNSGKLKPSRHPVSGYRIYRQDDLESLLRTDSLLAKRSKSLTPKFDWSQIGPTEHFVQFYENDDYLVESVSGYVSRALVAGEAALVIATEGHRQSFHRKLKQRSLDVAAARQRGQYIALDAAELLSQFMVNGAPDPARFERTVGSLIDSVLQTWPRVCAFGEMVALLWAEGNRDAACELESVWNDLAKRRSFALFCAYPLHEFNDEAEGASLADVCGCHTRVIPAESYSARTTADDQLRAIAVLQQKAQQLDTEIALRRRAERDQAMLAAIVESSQDAIISKSLDGIIRSWNAAAERLFGYSESEAVGQPITLIIPPERRQEESEILARLRRGERIEHYETVRMAKDGRAIDISLTISPLLDRTGAIIGASKIVRDITEHKRTQQAFAAAQRQVRLVTDSAPVFLANCDAQLRFKFVNQPYAERFGMLPEQIVGRRVPEVLGEEAYSTIAPYIAQVLAGQSVEYVVELPDHTGGRRSLRVGYTPEHDAAGNVVGWVAAIIDITDRTRAEEALAESEQRFRRLVELMPVGVYTCAAPSGVITYYNEQAVRLWGRTPTTLSLDERFCGSYRLLRPGGEALPHDECPMALALSEGREFRNQEVVIERPDGSRITALVNIDPIRDRKGQIAGAINVFHDMSALKEAERQLREADRRKDEFLATLAHELRNPLAPIRNSLHILRMTGQNSPAAERVHEMMGRQVSHMVRLVDDLLELSRISRGKIELKRQCISLATAVQHALETSKPIIEAGGHVLEVHLPPEQIVIDADLTRLSQVFANLLNNAAKYTNRGGTITVTARREGPEAVVSVRDTGIGIPPDMLGQVFDMFAQVDNPLRRSQDGLGIGLSLVRTLTLMHGGSVEARSDGLGQGSEFVVRLPVAGVDASGGERISANGEASARIRPAHRILAVDDNRDSADSLGMMLRFLGADVQVAYDGPSALEMLKTCKPSVILMDLGMPGMHGYDVARQIRQDPSHQNVLLIAMTGWGQEEDRRRSRESGFDHHLVKPVDLDALQALLASWES